MATAQNVIDRAASLLGVLGGTFSLLSADYANNLVCFSLLQDLVSEWGEDGLLEIPAPSAAEDALSIPDGSVRALTYNLAVTVAPIFGKTPNIVIAGIAEQTRDRLEADIDLDIEVDMSDLAFTHGHRYNINNDR